MNKEVDKTRINRAITSREVRLIDDEGNQVGVVPFAAALAMAEEKGMDLVEVAPQAEPPVCKIMNYGKYRYLMTKKEARSRKHQKQIQIKEMKFRPKTDEHDFEFKMNHIKRFIEKGNFVKVHVHFRGREITHEELGKELLERVAEQIKDIAVIESQPKIEGKNMTMVLTPKKQ